MCVRWSQNKFDKHVLISGIGTCACLRGNMYHNISKVTAYSVHSQLTFILEGSVAIRNLLPRGWEYLLLQHNIVDVPEAEYVNMLHCGRTGK